MRAALTFILFILTLYLALGTAWELFIVGNGALATFGAFLTVASALGWYGALPYDSSLEEEL